ncbi:phosphoglucomutase (alpha-D-glucose-1,6-bisphosphate-dependent) [Ningiella sp. W23]|uniref:phosphoglucomutase (alpha-D-glucose-1,6-bisphosphate-dependent) n=1 Tax=Ningiella sp. W23 TaxID=3023715 RepID=UPI0037564B36
MANHPLAGKSPKASQLINVAKLCSDYYSQTPDVLIKEQAVSFGTSGHRGSSALASFNDAHIGAICQALCEYRQANSIDGPLFIGKDTHALSEPALVTAIEVLVANGVEVVIQQDNAFTPTPVISQRIVSYNRGRTEHLADGIVITPSHNPPSDGGFKYNETHGGPAGGETTSQIQNRANEIIATGGAQVKRVPINRAMQSDNLTQVDFAVDYVHALKDVVDLQAISDAKVKMGTDPLGGSGLAYWDKIADKYSLDITLVNPELDQRFAFMRCDRDGKIRMDCSSAFAMSGLIEMKNSFDIAFGNDPDFDRHGIVCPSVGLMNPNHYLAVAIQYLYQNRPHWSDNQAIGKTLVSSSMIDRVANKLGRQLLEMPVGFKWFVDGLSKRAIAFAGEESAGGIFLQRDGQTWATDKDGFIMSLLAAEIKAKTDKDPGEHYQALTQEFGAPNYTRIDVAATLEQKQRLSQLDASNISASDMAGETITQIQTNAPGNNAPIGGVKVSTENGWFAARPSGTENVYKIYAESFKDETHLQKIIKDAEQLVEEVL